MRRYFIHPSSFHTALHWTTPLTGEGEKDPSLAPVIIRSLLKYWPLSASNKALMFLNETAAVLKRVQPAHAGNMLVIGSASTLALID